MGVPRLGQILETYPSVYREWRRETDVAPNVKRTLYIDVTGIAYGVICKYIEDQVKRERETIAILEIDDYRTDYEAIFRKLCPKKIADDVFSNKVLNFVPRLDDFAVFDSFRKIFIAHDNRAPLAKARVQEKRRRNKCVVPKELRDAVADEFYVAVSNYRDEKCDESALTRTDVVYDKTLTVGEGEWKCIREIWKDITAGNTEACYVLANDFDVVVGAYCLPTTPIDVNVIWKRRAMENFCHFYSKLIHWSTDDAVEKLLTVLFLNVYGNDYVPGLITTTSNYTTVRGTIARTKKLLSFHRCEDLYASLDKIGRYVFDAKDDNATGTDVDIEEWVTTITFAVIFVGDFLLNVVFNKRKTIVESVFFEKWAEFLRNKDEIEEEENESRRCFVTMSLWYLCYCTSAFKRVDRGTPNVDEKQSIDEDDCVETFEALPMRTPFKFNDERTRFVDELTEKRSLFDHDQESCIKNVYSIVKKIFTS